MSRTFLESSKQVQNNDRAGCPTYEKSKEKNPAPIQIGAGKNFLLSLEVYGTTRPGRLVQTESSTSPGLLNMVL